MAQAGQATQGFAATVSNAAHGLQVFGSMGHQVMSIQDRMEISNMNVMNATDAVFNSQLRYNDALKNYGENSQQAMIAHNQLERASNNLEKANKRADDSFWSMGLAAVGLVPHLITLGGAATTFLSGITLSVAGLTTALTVVAPYILILGAALGVMYYVWQKNRVELDANAASLKTFTDSTDGAAKSLKNVRAIVEKPVSRPSLMDIFNENVYQNPDGSYGRRTPQEKTDYGTNTSNLGFVDPTAYIQTEPAMTTTVSRLDQFNANFERGRQSQEEIAAMEGRHQGIQPQFTPRAQPYEPPNIMGAVNDYKKTPAYANDMKALDDTKLAKNIDEYLRSPRQIFINQSITVDKNSNPMAVGSAIGEGVAKGIDLTRFKYGGNH